MSQCTISKGLVVLIELIGKGDRRCHRELFADIEKQVESAEFEIAIGWET